MARFTGTIVGVGDLSSQWSESKWRSLKVEMLLSYRSECCFICFHLCTYFSILFLQIQWDEHAAVQRPERVSPWEIEPFVASAPINLAQPVVKCKRPRPVEISSSGMKIYCCGLFID